ncbi:solute carrier family 22 member 3-like [Tribolium madens]|uniref:solute carrier family 22 member 3-like n=1 Tax=Tribolium madens TaxID=41895 RepID=UPI001CF7302F|nr:solute carrier family 22 member 3-like [Tribolium madens]
MKFFRNNVLVSDSSPPEEILPAITGCCGFWQISICFVAFLAQFIHGLDVTTIQTSSPLEINYTCKGTNSTECSYPNGTKCMEFEYHSYSVISFTKKMNLVCEKEDYVIWIKNLYRMGLILGYFLSGVCGEKFGLKPTAMVFISLQSLTGLFILSMRSFEIVIFFVFTHGVFSNSINLIPAVAVTDVVGNRWRTLALGVAATAVPLSISIFPFFYNLFSDISGIVAADSVFPLVLLLPLIYFRDSPNYVVLILDFVKEEKILRRISRCNKRPLPSEARLAPVQVIVDSGVPQRCSFWALWKPTFLRNAYCALLCSWFFLGYTQSLIMEYAYKEFKSLSLFGCCGVFGCITAVILCHFIQQKVIIGIFTILKNISIGICILLALLWKHPECLIFRVGLLSSAFWMWGVRAALSTLTPRMFPTEKRCLCCGVCFSLYHLGYFLAILINYFFDYSIWTIGAVFLIGGVIELLASFWFWDVHNRELPDYLIDCLRFDKFYKPTRFLIIYENRGSQEGEVEVKVMDLNPTELPVRKK